MAGKPPPPRRSAGMLGSPVARRAAPAISSIPPKRAAVETPAAQPRASRYPQPEVLMGEVAAPRGTQVSEYRDAFRAFMTRRRLKPSQWARDAGVPLGELMAYLTGRVRFFSPGTAEKLAGAAGVSPDTMFR